MKGVKHMACKHKRIMSKNCELFCLDCGEKLPADFQKKPEAPTKEEPAPAEKKPARKKVAK